MKNLFVLEFFIVIILFAGCNSSTETKVESINPANLKKIDSLKNELTILEKGIPIANADTLALIMKKVNNVKNILASLMPASEFIKLSTVEIWAAYDKRSKEIHNSTLQGSHTYWIGMSDADAQTSLGRPDHINRTVNSNGKREQWVYENKNLYLYFDNGKLTSYQE
jgi:hypothetical protein